MSRYRLVWALMLLALAAVPKSGFAAVTAKADYQFQGTYASSVGSAPDLAPLGPGTNSFISDTVDGVSREVLHFPMANGVLLTPISKIISPTSYTIVVTFRFDSVDGWRMIIDPKNATQDVGLYDHFGQLFFYPVAGGTAPITPGKYLQVALTRDDTGTMVGYVDGVPQFTIDDSTGQHGVIIGDTLRFFRDDDACCGDHAENSAGAVARIRIFDHALGSDEINALDRAPIPTALSATPAIAGTAGPSLYAFSLSATLTRVDNHSPVEKQTVTFTAGTTALCTATTNSAGVASCQAVSSTPSILQNNGYSATFAPAGDYSGSTATAGLIA